MNKDILGSSNFFEYPLTSISNDNLYQNNDLINDLINDCEIEIPLTVIKYINIYPNLKKSSDNKLNEQGSVNNGSN